MGKYKNHLEFRKSSWISIVQYAKKLLLLEFYLDKIHFLCYNMYGFAAVVE